MKVKKSGQTENAVRIQIILRKPLLHDSGDCLEEDECPTVTLSDDPDCKCLLIDTVQLKILFCKPNCNIVNE